MLDIVKKRCSTCGVYKVHDEFYNDKSRFDGFSNRCKSCMKKYRRKNRNKLLESSRKYNKKNALREKEVVEGRVCSQCKKYKLADDFWKSKHTRDGLYSCCKICKKKLESTDHRQRVRAKNSKDWRLKNRKKYRETCNKWDKHKRKTDVSYRLRRNVMHAVVAAVQGYLFDNKSKSLKTRVFDHLPYSSTDLKEHLESLWEPWMNWDNYGRYDKNKLTWQIDHIIPQSKLPFVSFSDDNFKKLWSLNNLRPLETVSNIKKGNK